MTSRNRGPDPEIEALVARSQEIVARLEGLGEIARAAIEESRLADLTMSAAGALHVNCAAWARAS